jgi:hypothetical protein
MTEAIWVALVASLTPSLVALGALMQGRRNGRKADEIHVLVNSNLTAVKTDLALATVCIEGLQADLALANTRIEALQTLLSEQPWMTKPPGTVGA